MMGFYEHESELSDFVELWKSCKIQSDSYTSGEEYEPPCKIVMEL
jgi:hypothetical protein